MFEGLPPRPSFPPRFPFPLPGPFAAFGQQAPTDGPEGDAQASSGPGAAAAPFGRLPGEGLGRSGIGQAALERLTLLLNHVLAAETEAMSRLAPHAGRSLRVTWNDWPAWLPLPASASWRITPPGLLDLEISNETAAATPIAADLEVLLDARSVFSWALQAPLHAAGARPPMSIQGDADLATVVAWLADNLRWDIEDDLARVVGDGPAHLIGRVGRGLGEALQRLLAPLRR